MTETIPADKVLATVRAHRNGLLAATDAMVSVPDFPITAPQKAALIAYRQALRDLPSLPIAFGVIPWPTWPASVTPPVGVIPPVAIGGE